MTTLALLMDPIATIKPQKDSSLAMALAAQARGWASHYLEMDDLYLHNGQACARLRELAVRDNNNDGFSLGEPQDQPLAEHNDIIIKPLDVIGDFLTEVTVTSPTGVRELDTLYGLDIGGQLMDAIERKLNA